MTQTSRLSKKQIASRNRRKQKLKKGVDIGDFVTHKAEVKI